jgi:hypothetical protein
MKLLYPFANVMGLHFPIGKIEESGTCQFATATCIEECCACHLDTGLGIEHKIKENIYQYFLDNESDVILKRLVYELRKADCDIFTWFGSGDCPSTLTDRFFQVVKGLDLLGIIQTGITRNKSLWHRCLKLSGNAKVLLTIEKIEDGLTPGMYSLPDYKCGAIDIVTIGIGKVYITAGCGGEYYEHKLKILETDKSHLRLDCRACYINKTGCFKVVNV